MTTIIDSTQISRQARRVDPAKLLLTLLMLIPFVLGWLAGSTINALSWIWAAIIVGYRSAAMESEGGGPNPSDLGKRTPAAPGSFLSPRSQGVGGSWGT